MFDRIKEYISEAILRYLSQPTVRYAPFFAPDPEVIHRAPSPATSY